MKRNLLLLSAALSALLFSVFSAASADPIKQGDVIAGVSNATLYHYNSSLMFEESLTAGTGYYTTGMAFDKAGNLYATNFSDGGIYKFRASDAASLGAFATGLSVPESLVFDAAGNLYVSEVGGELSNGIVKFDANGNQIGTFLPNVRTDWMDLAKDQHTMYWTDEGTAIHRVDLTTGTILSDFTTITGGHAFAFRILADGGVLLADGADIKRFDSAGNQIQTYDVPGLDNWFALNRDPNGTSFWSGDDNTADIYEFDIATGQVLAHINTGTGANSLFGLTVAGELTAGTESVVPEGSSLSLLGGAIFALCGGALWRRRKR